MQNLVTKKCTPINAGSSLEAVKQGETNKASSVAISEWHDGAYPIFKLK